MIKCCENCKYYYRTIDNLYICMADESEWEYEFPDEDSYCDQWKGESREDEAFDREK